MFTRRQVSELVERRQLLVIEADLYRSLIGLERARLRGRLAGLQAARERGVTKRPLLIAGGAFAGLLAIRHWRILARWFPVAITALRFARALKG